MAANGNKRPYAFDLHRCSAPLPITVPSRPHAKEAWVALQSDQHADSSGCALSLYQSHLKLAKDRGAIVLGFGDLFDAMQGFADKRQTRQGDDGLSAGDRYIDNLVASMVEKHKGFESILRFLSVGNHETTILKYHNSSVLHRFADEINRRGGKLDLGAYRGYLLLNVLGHKVRLYYHHGSGGSAPVTKGMTRTSRRAEYIVDADIVVTGHIHTGYVTPIIRERSDSPDGRHVQLNIQLPSYQNMHAIEAYGFVSEREFAPSPLGMCFLWFRRDGNKLRTSVVTEYA